MPAATYQQRRGELETYFDRTARDAWARLTSDAPVGRIRATVRAGRTQMRTTLLDWLPADLSGRRILDAGCGTGAFAVEAARRGASVVAVDLSEQLVALARERQPAIPGPGTIAFRVGDLLDPSLGRFDHVVAMDSLIHYCAPDMLRMLSGLASRADRSMLVTFAPKTPLLGVMHAVGRLFPRGDRAPAIEPVAAGTLLRGLAGSADMQTWRPARQTRVSAGFYISHALELVRG